MNYGTWYTYNGVRWRFERLSYSVSYDRSRPILVTVEGTSMMAHVANSTQARDAAHRIINNMGGTDESLRTDG